LCGFAALTVSPGQLPTDPPDVKLPSGKSQRDEMLKEEHKRNLEEAGRLVKLSEELLADLEKSDRFIVSVENLRRLDEIEKLTKRIRGRLKRH
jgi:hypothetical protein